MSFAAAFVLIAQSAASAGAPASADVASARSAPVAERVTARATILRPARISFDLESSEVSVNTRRTNVQRGRDAAGTVWVEFS